MNIALVILDALRKDAFDRHFDWLPGVRFESAWAPSHWTVPVHGSLFTGKYPSEAGIHAKNQFMDYPEEVLAEILSEEGYTTRAFSSNPNISPNFDFDRGFDEFSGGWRLKAFDSDIFRWDRFINETEGEGPQRFLKAAWKCVWSDCDTYRSLRHGMDLKMRDFQIGRAKDDGATETQQYVRQTDFGDTEFLFLNLMEAHAPYDPPGDYKTVDATSPGGLRATLTEPDADEAALQQAYDDAVKYLSDRYREVFGYLQESFDYVITVSDHGELLGERGQWEHLCGLDTALTHVPLVISGPNLDGYREETVSLLDVHRTILDLVDSDGESRGKNLLEFSKGRPCLTEYHGLTSGHQDGLKGDGYASTPLEQEWHGVALPGDYYGYESGDGWRERGETSVDDPQSEMERIIEELEVREIESTTTELSDAALEQLKDLGYA